LQEAALWGHLEIVELLEEAGAQPPLTEVERFLAACTQPDRPRAQQMRDSDPSLLERARSDRPDQLVRAAEKNRLDAVALLIELGFDVNAIARTAPLHEAAMRGNIAMITLLLDHGADPNLRDRSFDATAAGWAEHHGQLEAQRLLERIQQ
jgi:ankyrin repeat protein